MNRKLLILLLMLSSPIQAAVNYNEFLRVSVGIKVQRLTLTVRPGTGVAIAPTDYVCFKGDFYNVAFNPATKRYCSCQIAVDLLVPFIDNTATTLGNYFISYVAPGLKSDSQSTFPVWCWE